MLSTDSMIPSLQLKQDIQSLLFGNGSITTMEDIQRWFHQGFEFCDTPTFGLRQKHGGPCGVLAAIQSEILKFIYFEVFSDHEMNDELIMPEKELLDVALSKAIQTILQRSSETDQVYIVLGQSNLSNSFSSTTTSSTIMMETIVSFPWEIVGVSKGNECFEFIFHNINQFTSRTGCLLFVIALILTRGMDTIRADMDMSSNTLVGQFGHTTQELINLLLIGRATSNTIDGEEMLGDSGLSLKGVNCQSSIGYLTHLESFGNCRVGDFYKYPEYPIWIIGGTSHYSVLFSPDLSINQQSDSEKILSALRRAFNIFDSDKCGFIQSTKLRDILNHVGLQRFAENDSNDLQRLQKHLQVEGDIIIWGNFFETVSKLIRGDSLDSVIGTTSINQNRGRSDSEVARQLQEAYDRGDDPSRFFGWENYMDTTEPTRVRSDSEIARDLQATLNTESNTNISSNHDTNYVPNYDPQSISTFQSNTIYSQSNGNLKQISKDYILYYFNGMEGPTRSPQLVSFTITVEQNEDAIGSQVALGGSNIQGNGSCPIEEVIRTRWSSCKINWKGQNIPNIE